MDSKERKQTARKKPKNEIKEAGKKSGSIIDGNIWFMYHVCQEIWQRGEA